MVLPRVVGVPGAVLLGLGSMLGTGIFVSLGLAAEVAGPAVILAVALAAVVATFNGLASAELAASHPVSGGTYEYGHLHLTPTLGFLAGWLFLCAKSASAATAALGFAGYVLAALGRAPGAWERSGLGLLVVGCLTALATRGMARSNRANAAIVSVTIFSLALLVAVSLPAAARGGAEAFTPFFVRGAGGVLHATALMFVAYTGYGRIAVLGEEVRDPERTIPRAVVASLVAAMALYVAVGAVAVGVVGAPGLAAATRAGGAPLEIVAAESPVPAVRSVVALGAMTAMASVLLNLLLGLSRVLLAMARRGDMPRGLARLEGRQASPRGAVAATGALVGALVLVGDVKVTWSFSALTVLGYYALTNLAALRLPPAARRMPRAVPALGLASCLGLTAWIDPAVWTVGLALVATGLVWHRAARRLARGRAA